MQEYINLFVKSIFIDNMVFAFFLGMCSYLAVSKTVKTAVGLGVAVVFVQTITVPVNYIIQNYLLSPGALSWISPSFATMDLTFLSFMMFIATIASMTQLVEMIIEKFSPALYPRTPAMYSIKSKTVFSSPFACSFWQMMWESARQKLRTLINPVSSPDFS